MTTQISGTSGIITPALDLTTPLAEADGGTGTTSAYKLEYATAKTATGTFVDFTGIPAWAKRITVMINGVSSTGTSNLVMRFGTSSGVESTGYSGGFVGAQAGSTGTGTPDSTGFLFTVGSSAGNIIYGSFSICNMGNNLWVCSGGLAMTNTSFAGTSAGTKSLSGVLDRIRFTSSNGTDTFDAGTINVMWEGF